MHYIMTLSKGLAQSRRVEETKNHQTSLPVRNRKPFIIWPEGQQTWHASLKGLLIILKWTYKSNIFITNQSCEKSIFLSAAVILGIHK